LQGDNSGSPPVGKPIIGDHLSGRQKSYESKSDKFTSCKTPFLFMTTAEKIAAAKKRIAELKLLIKLWTQK